MGWSRAISHLIPVSWGQEICQNTLAYNCCSILYIWLVNPIIDFCYKDQGSFPSVGVHNGKIKWQRVSQLQLPSSFPGFCFCAGKCSDKLRDHNSKAFICV